MFKHFLITRFNLRNPEWVETKAQEPVLGEHWMTERMKLFRDFCLPSVASQSNKNFQWLIFLDTHTGDRYKSEMKALTQEHPFIKTLYIDGMPVFKQEVAKAIGDSPESAYLITSRIDNDDCIHKDFVSEIQAQFDEQEFQAIDVMDGYTLQVDPIVRLGKKEHIFNPFISLIEKRESFRTVWAYDHAHWKKVSQVIAYRKKRLWMSVIHQQNKINEFDGYGDVKWESVSDDFRVSADADRHIRAHQTPVSEWRMRNLRNLWHVKYKVAIKQFKRSLGLYRLKGRIQK